jgi:S1-C subfamily serine protease
LPIREDEEPPQRNNVPWIVGGAVACSLVLAGTVIFIATRTKEKDKPDPDPVAVAPRPPTQQPASLPFLQPVDSGGSSIRPPVTLPGLNPLPTPAAEAKPPGTEPQPTPVDAQPIAKGKLTAEARDKVKRATVYVRVTLPDGRKASGTGFFGVASDANLVVTNAHVVGMLAPKARRPRSIEVFVNSGESNEKRTTASVLGVDRASDLSLLRIEPVAGLPAPLGVKSANGLGELDEVYVFGFPLGENLGKEITIRPSSVSSLRKKNGVLDRVQVNGGMDPGNSGGPVVDAAGDVIGVAVSGIQGRQINFAIPADRVGGMLNGRIAELGMGQTYRTATGVAVPMTMVMVDPRGQVQRPSVDVWIGDKGANRPPAKTRPADVPGDTPHLRVELKDYDRVTGVARGDLELPELPAGKEYWMQPVWVNAAGQEQWAGANFFMLPNVPVERKPAQLLGRQQNGRRTLNLTIKTTLRPGNGDDEKDGFVLSTEAKMSEEVAGASNQGANVGLRYLSLSRTLSVPGGPARPSKLLEQVLPYKDRILGVLRVDAFGKLVQNDVVFQGVPDPIAGALKAIHLPTQSGLEAMTILMPNKEVQPGDRWKGRTSLPIDQPGRFETGEMDVTYTYLGRRRVGGREEAVVALDGVVRQGRGSDVDLGGNASGTALIDLQTGRVTSARTTVTVELEADVAEPGEKPEKLKLLTTLEVRLERKW